MNFSFAKFLFVILISQNVLIFTGHIEVLKKLQEYCEYQEMLEKRNEAYYTAFLLAAHHGHFDIVKLLIEEGKANIKATDGSGSTALIIAGSKGYLEIIDYMLQLTGMDSYIPWPKTS